MKTGRSQDSSRSGCFPRRTRKLAQRPGCRRRSDLPKELKHADRQELDREVLLALGVPEVRSRDLARRLYDETTRFFNEARLVELQAMRNRLRSKKGRVASAHEMAREIFEEFDSQKCAGCRMISWTS